VTFKVQDAFVHGSRIPHHEKFMSDILDKTIVLVLNRNWQAINIRTPADAFCQMATNVATALEMSGGCSRLYLAKSASRTEP
jgi:hypothetical protein